MRGISTALTRSWSKMPSSARSWWRRTKPCWRLPHWSGRKAGPHPDRQLARPRPSGAKQPVGPRTRSLSRLRFAGRKVAEDAYRGGIRPADSGAAGPRAARSPHRHARFALVPRASLAALARATEHEPLRRRVQPAQLLARTNLAGGQLALVVVTAPSRRAAAGRGPTSGISTADREQWFWRVFRPLRRGAPRRGRPVLDRCSHPGLVG